MSASSCPQSVSSALLTTATFLNRKSDVTDSLLEILNGTTASIQILTVYHGIKSLRHKKSSPKLIYIQHHPLPMPTLCLILEPHRTVRCFPHSLAHLHSFGKHLLATCYIQSTGEDKQRAVIALEGSVAWHNSQVNKITA